MNLNRVYNKIYSLPFTIGAGTVVPNQKLYLQPAPFLENKVIDAISFEVDYNQILTQSAYLTIVNGNNQIMLDNYPLFDLWNNVTNGGSVNEIPWRLRLFNIKGIISQNSYVTTAFNFTTTGNLKIGSFIFYEKK